MSEEVNIKCTGCDNGMGCLAIILILLFIGPCKINNDCHCDHHQPIKQVEKPICQ